MAGFWTGFANRYLENQDRRKNLAEEREAFARELKARRESFIQQDYLRTQEMLVSEATQRAGNVRQASMFIPESMAVELEESGQLEQFMSPIYRAHESGRLDVDALQTTIDEFMEYGPDGSLTEFSKDILGKITNAADIDWNNEDQLANLWSSLYVARIPQYSDNTREITPRSYITPTADPDNRVAKKDAYRQVQTGIAYLFPDSISFDPEFGTLVFPQNIQGQGELLERRALNLTSQLMDQQGLPWDTAAFIVREHLANISRKYIAPEPESGGTRSTVNWDGLNEELSRTTASSLINSLADNNVAITTNRPQPQGLTFGDIVDENMSPKVHSR